MRHYNIRRISFRREKRNMEETFFIDLTEAREKIRRVTKVLEELEISLKDEDGNFLCMYDILRALSDKFQELDPEQNLCYNKEKERERERELWRNSRK